MNYRKYLIGLIVLVAIGILMFSGRYLDWLWFKSMGASSVFWVTLITGPLVKFVIGIIVFIFLSANMIIAMKSFNRVRALDDPWPEISKETIVLPAFALAAILAFVLASGLGLDWATIQQYLHQVRTGVVDPTFGKDLGFYFFTFPLLQKLSALLQSVLFLTLIGSGLIYFLAKAFTQYGRFWQINFPAKFHLTVLTILFLLSKLWSYYLKRYDLLYQETTRLTGINYTAEHANLAALSILTWVVIGIIGVLIYSLFRKNSMVLIGSLAGWAVLSIILGGIYPGLIQSLVVAPNEYQLEEPYLKKHIQATREAFGLDRIKNKPFRPDDRGSSPINTANPALTDLRLWDYRPLKSSYNQLQSIRSYYDFTDIDIDRYPSAQGQRQVMLSARELTLDNSDRAKTWINLHLAYTHGYGFAANQVNQFTAEGQPIFISRDLPPMTDPDFPGLQVKRPEIYFGELTDDYVIVNTKTKEFDYPQGDRNIESTYQEKTGIPLNSLLTKLLFALKYQESNFLLSTQLTPESQIIINRNITGRVRKLAPFLRFDNDPYLVVSGSRLYWIIDAYTTSAYYPYARRHQQGINYIRNSVKTVIDAYNGTVNFYVTDDKDPIMAVWQRIFPKMFRPVSAAPKDLVAHFRYPEDMMLVQRDILNQYHMTDTKTFYLQEDLWEIPVQDDEQLFEPYYVTLMLPGETKGEFVMMQPFSPNQRQNLISWLVARCDGPNYGELILYTLPKDKAIYGPAQIANRINQNQTISEQITLWDQKKSQVVWGNLLIVPIENSILYVKPLFLQSEKGEQAELKLIVMLYQNQVLIGNTVEEALANLRTGAKPQVNPNRPETGSANETQTQKRAEILRQIEDHTRAIQRLLQQLNANP